VQGAYEEMDAIKKLQRGATSGHFNMSKPKTYIEQVEYDNRHVPGPASYELPSAKNLKGGRFNMSKSKTEVEWICYRAAQVPAPGEYGVEERMPNGGKFNMVSGSPAAYLHKHAFLNACANAQAYSE